VHERATARFLGARRHADAPTVESQRFIAAMDFSPHARQAEVRKRWGKTSGGIS
jgi:hypothetical protein